MAHNHHALILGASGISGWALLNTIRTYPTPDAFSKITATTNRPLTLEEAQIPEDKRINLVNGIDFTKDVSEVETMLKDKVHSIETVTHVFFMAYIHKSSFDELKEVNVKLIKSAMTAISNLAPHLEAVILQTGGKYYGVEFSDKLPINAPLKESEPRIQKPYYDNIFYYPQADVLTELSAKAKWTWTEIRPDVIIGFVPNNNAMDCARGIALYLSLHRELNGKGSKVHFPGTAKSWKNTHTDTFQDILARMEIHVALHQKKCGSKHGEAFNCADGAVETWREKWPRLCKYFGLVGEGPDENADSSKLMLDFVDKNKPKWENVVKEHHLKFNAFDTYDFNFLYFVMVAFDFNREYDLRKCRDVGFEDEVDTVDGFITAFERLKIGGIIPKY